MHDAEKTQHTRRKSGRVVLHDVAKLAKVSTITVSRFLRSPDKVAKETKSRIEQAISELNYIPDPNASRLASARSNVIGILIPSISNTVFSEVLEGVYDKIQPLDFQVQIGNFRYQAAEEERLARLFIGQGVAALLVTGFNQSPETIRLLSNCNCPVVQIMDYREKGVDMVVGLDHQRAASAMVEHLVEQGCRHIGCIAARLDPRARSRVKGYRNTLKQHKLYQPALERMTKQYSSVTVGRDLCSQLLTDFSDLDGLFCINDDLALGALFACQNRGKLVPDELAIAGFNDLEYSAAADPPISSVATYRYKMGVKAISMAIAAVENKAIVKKSVDLGYKLMIRQSSTRNA